METMSRKVGRPKRQKSRTGVTVDLGSIDPKTGSTSRMFWRDELERVLEIDRSTFTRWLSNLITYSTEFQRNWIPRSERFSELHVYYLKQYKALSYDFSGGQLREAIAKIPEYTKENRK